MIPIKPGVVFTGKFEKLKLDGCYRILQVLHEDDKGDRVVFIPVPTGPRKIRKLGQPSYYAKGFIVESLNTFKLWVDEGLIVQVEPPASPARWFQSDEKIVESCPEKKRIEIQDENGKKKLTTHALLTRDRKWALIAPLIQLAKSGGVPDVSHLDALVEERAKEARASIGQLYDALHRFYAFGEKKNALLPNTQNCGAPGIERFGKNGIRLGRLNAAAKAGNLELAGKICNEQDRENLRDGWQTFVVPGTTVEDAFYRMSATFYSTGYETKHGSRIPTLLPAHQRPTLREFQTHGPGRDDRYAAARRFMGENAWARDCRPLVGTAQDGIPAIGQVGSLDASPIDVNLTTIFDVLRPVGVGRALFVSEAVLGLILGWHVAIGGMGVKDAKLAVLRAATDKEDLLKRLDLSDLPVEDFPWLLFDKMLSDNGELRAIPGIESCVDHLHMGIEFISSGRADRNSPAESGHHVRHRGLDHHLTGTTHGRRPKRGEEIPITKALLNRYQYERLLVLWIHWHNTKQRVPHLVPTEMRRDMAGKHFNPTRIEIYRWAEEKGYVSGRLTDALYLRAHLLPTFTATIQRKGLVLHRPGTGDAVELLHGALFNSTYVQQTELCGSFGPHDLPHVEVKVDPDDLSQVLLIDDKGIHVIPNVSKDEIFINEGCVADLCAKNEAQKIENVEAKSKVDQDAVEQRAYRTETEDFAKAEKKTAIANRGKPATSGCKRPKVRENQAADRAAALDQAAARAQGQQTDAATPKYTAEEQPVASTLTNEATTAKASSFHTILQSQLKNFHQARGQNNA